VLGRDVGEDELERAASAEADDEERGRGHVAHGADVVPRDELDGVALGAAVMRHEGAWMDLEPSEGLRLSGRAEEQVEDAEAYGDARLHGGFAEDEVGGGDHGQDRHRGDRLDGRRLVELEHEAFVRLETGGGA